MGDDETTYDPRQRVGETLGDYHLTGLIGEGGFGAIYSATRTDGANVALKLLHTHLTQNREIVMRFRREARAATALGHPHIIKVFDAGAFSDGTNYQAMELLSGQSLKEALEGAGPMSVGRACRILVQVCEALSAVHEKGIIHRDMKPDNVFLAAQDGNVDFVKVLDFGVSKITEDSQSASMLTRTGTAVGTPFYMPPEQAQGKKSIDHRADIYAVGVMLYRMLTGQHPFEDKSYPMLVLKICTEDALPLSEFRRDLPVTLVSVVDRMLQKEPDDRYSSCGEVAAELSQYVGINTAPDLTHAGKGAGDAFVSSPTLLKGRQLKTTWKEGDDVESPVASSSMALRLGMVALMVLGAVGAFGWWATQRQPVAQNSVELPPPSPPLVAPFRVPAPPGLGWEWINPLPRAMQTGNAVSVGASDLAVLVGDGGFAMKLQKKSLARWQTGTTKNLLGVDFLGPAQAIAVGEEGTISVLLQSGAKVIDSGTTHDLRRVVASPPLSATVVGDQGTFIRLTVGKEPRSFDLGTKNALNGLYVRDGETWIVGDDGFIVRVTAENTAHEERPASGPDLNAITFCNGSFYSVGNQGLVLRRSKSGTWNRISTTESDDWTGVACLNGFAVASGNKGNALGISGDKTQLYTSGEHYWRDVGAKDGQAWFVGNGGSLATFSGRRFRVLTKGPRGAILSMATLGGLLVGVGQWGNVFRRTGSGEFALQKSVTDAALGGVAKLDDRRLLAVGDAGTLVEITWDGMRMLKSPTQDNLRAVVAKDGQLLAVGVGGAVLRGMPGALDRTSAGKADFWDIAGTPENAIAVGDEGNIWTYKDSVFKKFPCEFTHTLRTVIRHPTLGTFAAGDGGVVLSINEDDQTCALSRSASTPKRHILELGVGTHGNILAVGTKGMALTHKDGKWAEVNIESSGFDLVSILNTKRDVFVGGAAGVVLRHPRL